MKYKLWLHCKDGYLSLVVQDTSKTSHIPGSWLLRDQSSYDEDNGKLVWKNAYSPFAVSCAVKDGGGICIAEAEYLFLLPDPNIPHETLNRIWSNQ